MEGCTCLFLENCCEAAIVLRVSVSVESMFRNGPRGEEGEVKIGKNGRTDPTQERISRFYACVRLSWLALRLLSLLVHYGSKTQSRPFWRGTGSRVRKYLASCSIGLQSQPNRGLLNPLNVIDGMTKESWHPIISSRVTLNLTLPHRTIINAAVWSESATEHTHASEYLYCKQTCCRCGETSLSFFRIRFLG